MPILKTNLRETKTIRNIVKGEKIKAGDRKNDIKITDIRDVKTPSAKPLLVFDYKYTVNYNLKEPKGQKMGSIEIIGEIFYAAKKEEADEIMKTWKKKKTIEGNLMPILLNAAMSKSTVEAIEQSHKVGLPSPIPLPRLTPQRKSSAA